MGDKGFSDTAQFNEAGTWERDGGRDGVMDGSAKLRGCLYKAEPSRAGYPQIGTRHSAAWERVRSKAVQRLQPEDVS